MFPMKELTLNFPFQQRNLKNLKLIWIHISFLEGVRLNIAIEQDNKSFLKAEN